MLPAVIFHALATANYSMDMASVIVMMFVMILVTFVIGHLLRPVIGKACRKYLPYLVSCYEGGMIAYALFASLFGQESSI